MSGTYGLIRKERKKEREGGRKEERESKFSKDKKNV